MRRWLGIVVVLSCAPWALGQSISLEKCLEATRQHHPTGARRAVYEELGEHLERALWYAYIPQWSLEGRVTYQTDVPSLELELPQAPGMPQVPLDIPEIPKLQYQAFVEAKQLLWDGGRVRAGVAQTRAAQATQVAEAEVALKQVEEGVTELYFSLLMIEQQQHLQKIWVEELSRQSARLESALRNGVAREQDLDLVRVEQLKAAQSEEQLRASRSAVIEALEVYTGLDLSEQTVATIPDMPMMPIIDNGRKAPLRAEHAQMDAELLSAEALWSRYKAGGMPTIALFARGGYGRPGLNLLSPDPKPFALGGVSISWNFGQLYDYSTQKKKLESTHQLIELQRQAFEIEIARKTAEYKAEAREYESLMERDKEIVALRKRMSERSKLQEHEGTLSTADYLQELSHYHAAEQTMEVHRIQYLRSLYRLKCHLGL